MSHGNASHGQLPQHVAPLTPAGINQAAEIARSQPDQAKAAAQMIQDNPKELIERVFQLTPTQHQNLSKMSDDDLKNLLQPLTDALQRGNFKSVQVVRGSTPLDPNEELLQRDPSAVSQSVSIEKSIKINW